MEHPISEEITGIDLVEQQILIAAGHKLTYKQSDVKIDGHAVEYRVYAEDPARKFLPSIGFLTKYREPKPHVDMRIDTGVREGSEISMYYDPMISKLITWGKDRQTALNLLNQKFDEYVVQGVAHNIGFGKSIVENDAFIRGEYSTAFIPNFYPDGYHGTALNTHDKHMIAIAAFKMKNDKTLHNYVDHEEPLQETELYVTIPNEGVDHDFKVVQDGNSFTVTELATGESKTINLTGFNFEHYSLLELHEKDKSTTLQFDHSSADLHFNFQFRGQTIKTKVFDSRQYKYKHFMAVPVKLDTAKMVLSPMPGTIVTMNVEAGQTVVDGQVLCVIEAMKMQNLIKSQREGKIKNITVKAGDSVSVDQILIEFE